MPAGSTATTGQTIEATTHNTPLADLETDMNTARPVVAGGTGATTAADARTNLGLSGISSDGTTIAATLDFAVDTNTLFVDVSTDRVGIGTASPSYPLHVTAAEIPLLIANTDGSATHSAVFTSGGTKCRINMADSASSSNFQAAVGSEGNDLAFYAGNSNVGRFDATGGGFCVGRESDSTSDTGAGAIIASGGKVSSLRGGTGFSTHFEAINDANVTPTIVGSITSSGSTTSYNTSSDARLKENVADAGDAGAIVDAIEVRSFDWIATGEHQRFGFIAQEVEGTFPEMVSKPSAEDDPAQMRSVDYSKLVPVLVKEIQSLRRRVADLEA